jgi:hypothetical protein
MNILYWFFTKYKRVIRNILTSKLYRIIHDFDIGVLVKAIVDRIFKIKLLLIIYIDLKLFYKYLVKLETI